ncbi:aminoglycoside phosphotransferase family protein, partial [Streptomyces sp. NPDC049541]
LAALAGYFVAHALQPPPPGLPTLRAFQRAQGDTALAWLRRRLKAS